MLVKQETKLGKFLYIPGGPVVEGKHALDSLIKFITQMATKEGVNFVRFDPRVVDEKLAENLESLGLKRIQNYTQPECTMVLDLRRGLEEIKKGFSESTRYNIGWVSRKGIRVLVSEREEDIEIFVKLLKETSTRQSFRLHGEADYYKKQFKAFLDSGKAKLYMAKEPKEDGEEVLASAVVIKFGKTTTYLHAASSGKNPKLRAPYLMQWRIIEDAKNEGFETYDFWGAAKDDHHSDPWAGVTAFNKGFGGRRICYQPPYDLVLNKRYYLEKALERTRLLVRRWL